MNTIRARDRTPFQEAAEGAVLNGEETVNLLYGIGTGKGSSIEQQGKGKARHCVGRESLAIAS
ncbi:hypothetical protein BEI60_06290 [Eisenbergiella tayi]|nr:hypothetical protein BEI60_06290 [Eisenbergiella tayi]